MGEVFKQPISANQTERPRCWVLSQHLEVTGKCSAPFPGSSCMIQLAKCSPKGKWFEMLLQCKLSFPDIAIAWGQCDTPPGAGMELVSPLLPLKTNLGEGDATSLSVGPRWVQEAGGPLSLQHLLSFFRSTQTHLSVEPGCCIPTTPAVPLATTPSCCQKVFLAALFI